MKDEVKPSYDRIANSITVLSGSKSRWY